MAARFAPEPDEFDLFSPEAQQFLATPTRFAGTPGVPTRDTMADDFQLYKALGSTGDSWGGRDTTYQVYDPYGTPTQTATTHEGGIQEGLKQFGTMAAPLLLTGGLGTALGSAIGLPANLATSVGNAIVSGLATQDPRAAVAGGLSAYASPYIGQAAGAASEAVGGGALGDIAGAAVSGGAKGGIGGLFTGNPLEAIGRGALGAGVSEAVGETGIPEPLQRAATTALLGGNPLPSLVGSLLTSPATPQGFNLPESTGWYDTGNAQEPIPELAPELPPLDFSEFYTAPEQASWYDAGFVEPAGMLSQSTVMPPNEMNRFLEANIEEPEVVDRLMEQYYPQLVLSGNLEPDFVVAQEKQGPVIRDTAGNMGEFIEGQWVPRADPMEMSTYVAPPAPAAPAPAAPAPAKAPVAAPTPSAKASGDVNWDALFGLGALGGLLAPQQKQPEYQLADVSRARSPFGSLPYSQDDLLSILRG